MLMFLLFLTSCQSSSGGESPLVTGTTSESGTQPNTTSTASSTPTNTATSTPTNTATATPTTTATDASVMPNTLQAHNFQILDRHPDPKLDCINDSMDVFIDVFGVVVMAT
ncbi:MAG: hypothetical protein CL771_07095, partial [Chloroflexi bacterium]|nr:hypothetical protein [Chloroflexota bacterium]